MNNDTKNHPHYEAFETGAALGQATYNYVIACLQEDPAASADIMDDISARHPMVAGIMPETFNADEVIRLCRAAAVLGASITGTNSGTAEAVEGIAMNFVNGYLHATGNEID